MPSTTLQRAEPEDIAVVGLGCLFPGAPDVGTFWRNIVGKVSAITDPPPEAWSEQQFFDPSSDANDRVYCRKGGYLGSLAYFDPLDHGIMPRAVEGGEPDQWLALHVARQALRDAGLEDASGYRERAALILGKGTYANRGTLSVIQHALIADYTIELLKTLQPALTDEDLRRIRVDLKRRLPRFDAETAPALIPNVTVGRIANRLDIMGPSYTIDAACASSLVAIDIAIKGLRQGEYDLALVGGLQVATPLPVLSLFCQLQALSASERIRPFDQDADGTLLSEGIGMAVLKRRSQAEQDGDRIYAFVKGSGVASDGRAVGVLAPRPEGEVLALRRAYGAAGVDPATVGLIEAHGTGTLVGDAVEVESLGRVFGERGAAARVALGSVKSMIGHTMPAAGMAGFIKAVLSLYDKTLPPTINVGTPSPRLKIERTPFYINSETRPWVHGDPQHPRRAGINAFGFGGINAHVVVEEAPAVAGALTHDTAWDSEVCLFSGSSRAEVITQAHQVSALLARQPGTRLMDLAYSLAAARSSAATPPPTLGIVARSTEDLGRKIDRALTRLADPACRRIKESSGIYYFDEPLAQAGKLAFVFPGEGAQYVNMLDDLCRYFPEVRACFDAMDRVLFDHPRGFRLSERVFPPPPFSDAERNASERALWQMDVAVEAVVTANAAMSSLLGSLGIVPDAMLGHSSGDYSAIRAAGMVDEAHNDQRIVELNDQHRGAEDTGEMPQQTCLFAVAGPRARVEQICTAVGANASVAMDNCRHQVVIAIDPSHAASLESALQDAGLLYERLAFDRPYHTAQFQPFAEKLRPLLDQWIVRGPAVPLYSCTNVGLYPSDVTQARQLAFDHWVQPVEFRRTIEKMWDDGVRLFVEAGPRGNLTAFIDDVLADRAYAAIPANVSRRSGLQQLHHLVAHLAAQGVSLRLDPLYARRRPETIDWDPAAVRPSARPVLGRVKLATGAPEMRLSPEMVELIVSRGASGRPVASHAVSENLAPAVPSLPAVPQSPSMASTPMPQPSVAAVGADAGTATVPLAAPGSRSAGSSAPRVMAAYLATMERLLTVEQSLMEQRLAGSVAVLPVAAASERVPVPAVPATLPLIEVITTGPATLTARCTLDLARQPFLRDHTLGRSVSADDPGLTGFAIVPFTSLMEVMAEAATTLVPGRTLVGMSEVRVHRWLAVDSGPVSLAITADVQAAGHVTVRITEPSAPEKGIVAEGVMRLGEGYPAPPAVQRLDLSSAQPYKLAPHQLYGEAMFHGPMFRGVRSIDRVGEDGAAATLTVVSRAGMLADRSSDGLVTDFVLLDQPGQVVGFWTSQFLERGFVVLPFRMGALHLYGPPPAAGQQLACRAHIALVGDNQVRSDLEVIDAEGQLWARFEAWEDRRFDLPLDAFRALMGSSTVRLGKAWRLSDDSADTGRLIAYRIGIDSFPAGWLHAHGGMWTRVLAGLTLSRRERQIWTALQVPPRRSLEWLLGRIAAKDAVCDYVQRRYHLTLRPADVEILPEPSGRPVIGGAWTRKVSRVPLVSIAHVEGTVIAVLTDGDGISGVGVDLERTGRMKPGMERMAFAPSELAHLGSVNAEEQQAWTVRLWCAKEAVAKATGGVVGPVSGALTIEGIDRQRGTVRVRCSLPGAAPISLPVSTACDGEYVVATCISERLHILEEHTS